MMCMIFECGTSPYANLHERTFACQFALTSKYISDIVEAIGLGGLMTKPVIASSWILVWAVLAVAACHAKPPAAAPTRPFTAAPAAPAPPPPPPPPPKAAAPAAVSPTDEEVFRRKSVDQLNAERPLSDVFFDYDQNTLRDEGRRLLQDDARWLKRWPSTAIRIDGHCDERGTGEYNLALGERRATVVRNYLVDLGVNGARIQVRSLGKEAPFCQQGGGESCWSQNRRGHFVIVQK
jgi:peptidoglycan-associated lipoprotein